MYFTWYHKWPSHFLALQLLMSNKWVHSENSYKSHNKLFEKCLQQRSVTLMWRDFIMSTISSSQIIHWKIKVDFCIMNRWQMYNIVVWTHTNALLVLNSTVCGIHSTRIVCKMFYLLCHMYCQSLMKQVIFLSIPDFFSRYIPPPKNIIYIFEKWKRPGYCFENFSPVIFIKIVNKTETCGLVSRLT